MDNGLSHIGTNGKGTARRITPKAPERIVPTDVEIVLLRPSEPIVDHDHDVQRELNLRHAKAIANDPYDPALFGIGYVSLRADGRYYILDGQHRCAAAIMAGQGESQVPFVVLRGLSIQDEAKKFRELNAHKLNVDAISLFKTGVEAGDPVNVEIAGILKAFGLTYGPSRSDGVMQAVAALVSVYNGRIGTKVASKSKKDSALPQSQLLTRTLTVLTQAWGRDRNAFDGLLIKGVAAFISKHDTKVDGRRLSQLLAKNSTAARAIGQIRALKGDFQDYAHGRGGAVPGRSVQPEAPGREATSVNGAIMYGAPPPRRPNWPKFPIEDPDPFVPETPVVKPSIDHAEIAKAVAETHAPGGRKGRPAAGRGQP